jgi:hypothetical protein
LKVTIPVKTLSHSLESNDVQSRGQTIKRLTVPVMGVAQSHGQAEQSNPMTSELYHARPAVAEDVLEFFAAVRNLYPDKAPALLDIGSRRWNEALVFEQSGGGIVGAVRRDRANRFGWPYINAER